MSRRCSRHGLTIALALSVLAGAGVGAYLRLRNPGAAKKSQDLAIVPLPTSGAADPPSNVAPGVEPIPTPAVDDIVISVDTDPDGVHVTVDGEARGVTPIDVRVKKSEHPLKVELAQTGFETRKVDVVPDRDQRLYFALLKQQKQIVPVKTPPKKERKQGFRRFD